MNPLDADTAQWLASHVQPHEAMLRAWLLSRFPQLEDLDDIVQESYIRLLTARGRAEVRQPKAFFFATARNLACDQFRRKKVARVEPLGDFDLDGVLDEGESVVETIARNQEIELMTQAIQSLPDRCRRVMTLRNVYGLAQKDIAAELGISVRTVESQVTIGLKRCTAFVRRQLDV